MNAVILVWPKQRLIDIDAERATGCFAYVLNLLTITGYVNIWQILTGGPPFIFLSCLGVY